MISYHSFVKHVSICVWIMVSKKSSIIYVQFKRCITKSTCLTEQTLDKTITNTKLKYKIGLGSHKN